MAMRDGTRLVADVYGASASPRPVLLERTPYGRDAQRTSDQASASAPVPEPAEQAMIFDEAGFVTVRQDVRGRGASEGAFEKYVNESEDGFDTISWIRDQPWCDGRVFMTGVSYSAHAQTAAAAVGAPLAGMILDSGGLWNAYEAGIRAGGAFELKQATWALRHARASAVRRSEAQRRALEAVDVASAFGDMPWHRGNSPLTAAPEYEHYLFDQWGRQRFDTSWTGPALFAKGAIDHFPRVPSVHIGSWYDPYVRTTVALFDAMAKRHGTTSLIMGPWTHGARATTHAGDVEFGAEAAFDVGLGIDYVRWRAEWLHLVSSGNTPRAPRVTYFRMGGGSGGRDPRGRLEHGGRWLTASVWPPHAAQELVLHLDASGGLSEEPAPSGTRTLRFDPDDPVPTIGGQVTSGAPVMRGGAVDRRTDRHTFGAVEPFRPLAERDDVLTFRTAPLSRPVTVAGPIVARLTLSSDVPDTDITITLVDEYPPSEDWPEGYAMQLTDGILRVRFREGFDREVLLHPGVPVEITVEAPDTANQFAAGHRIRLDIASSNFPRFDVNPNTGGTPWDRPRIAHNTMHLGEGRATLGLHRLPGAP